MADSRPAGTVSRHPLPFDKLSPLDFERLCLWLVEREGYERADEGRKMACGRRHFEEAGEGRQEEVVPAAEGWTFTTGRRGSRHTAGSPFCRERIRRQKGSGTGAVQRKPSG